MTAKKQVKNILKSQFEKELFKASLGNLTQGGPLCLNNFAYSLRELVRNILQRFSPDTEILKCTWYRPEKGKKKNYITRAMRIKYAIQGGLSDYYLKNILHVDSNSVIKNLLHLVETLSNFTHINEGNFALNPRMTLVKATEYLQILADFSDLMTDCRDKVIENATNNLEDVITNELISETISEIDELATHYYVDEVNIDLISVDQIKSDKIILKIDCTLDCEMQIGSNSDIKNDIGEIFNQSFPVSIKMEVQMIKPLGRYLKLLSYDVDTSSE